MAGTLAVPDNLREQIETFLRSRNIPLTVVAGKECDVRVEESPDREQSSMSVLYASGRITCGVALALARKLDIGSKEMGELLNRLKIKIKDCSLGCFT